MARVQSFLGDFRAALQNEKSTYSIYNSKVQIKVSPHITVDHTVKDTPNKGHILRSQISIVNLQKEDNLSIKDGIPGPNVSTIQRFHCISLLLPYIMICWCHLQFGDDHERTKESSECLKDLTQKAVTMQKTVHTLPLSFKICTIDSFSFKNLHG